MGALEDHPKLSAAISAKGVNRRRLWQEIETFRLAQLPLVHAWREAAQADGWLGEQTYKHEPFEHAWTLARDGFRAHGLARPIPGRNGEICKPEITIWGPDGATLDAPVPYDFSAIKAGLERCDQCGAFPIETKRYAFANRCCAECGPKFMASLPHNWAD